MNRRTDKGKGKKMQNTKNREVTTPTRESMSDYRCPECDGKTIIWRGRTKVNHRLDCPIRVRLLLTYPRFARILEEYRSTPN